MAKDPRTLKEQAALLLDKGKFKKALPLYLELEELEPLDGQWARRAGELYRRLGKNADAVAALERSADKYVRAGFLVKALAVCKMILQIDANHSRTQERLAKLNAQRMSGAPGGAGGEPGGDGDSGGEGPVLGSRDAGNEPPQRPTVPSMSLRGPAGAAPPVSGPAAPVPGPGPGSNLPEAPRRPTAQGMPRPAMPAPGLGPAGPGGEAPQRPTAQALRVPGSIAPAAGQAPAGTARAEVPQVPVPPTGAPRPSMPERQPATAMPPPPQQSATAVPPQQQSATAMPPTRQSATAMPPPMRPPATAMPPPIPRIPPPIPGAQPSPPAVPAALAPSTPPVSGVPAVGAPSIPAAATPPLSPARAAYETTMARPAPSGRMKRRTIPPDAPLDAVTLGDVVPGARPLGEVVPGVPEPVERDGETSGIFEIPIETDDIEDAEEPGDGALGPEARRALHETPLLSSLGPDAMQRLIDEVTLVQLDPGQILFREGEPGRTLYVIVEGGVSVVSEGPPRMHLSRLGEGDFFGEIALVTNQPRNATIAADTERGAQLLAIDRNVIGDLVEEEPQVLQALLRFLRDRLVDRLVHTSPLFAPYAGPEGRDLAARFRFLEVQKGAVVIEQGTKPAGLFVLLSGQLEAVRIEDAAERRLGTFGTGGVCGEMSLLANEPSLFTVRARSKCFMLMLPANVFREVIMTHPQVLMFVSELADERRRRYEAIVAGKADYDSGRISLV